MTAIQKYNLPHYEFRECDFDTSHLIYQEPYELDNGAVYTGQWSVNRLRWGKGTQVWLDGSVYKGHW